jgi:uncharacterized membrane protein
MIAPIKPSSRLAYIDWMRGFACLLMFQDHCYDSWLSAGARKSPLYSWSQLGGTIPAPLFIFIAGISGALITRKLMEKGLSRNAIARSTMLRGAEIYGLGLLFRLQEFVLGYPKSPWTDLFRVDILNILGLSMILMSVLCWLTAPRSDGKSRNFTAYAALAVAACIAIATPWIWTTARLHALPWPIESYFNGVHIFREPQPWLFPLFPWSAFAFAGLSVGFFLFSGATKRRETLAFSALGAAGIMACLASFVLDRLNPGLYSVAIYDYWHTSPNFFLVRCGILLVLVYLSYAWCRWGFGKKGFSPVIQLGTTSLIVYWVHIEFVYGRLSILPKVQCSAGEATIGLLIVFLAMLGLSLLRTNWKKRSATALQVKPNRAAATAESV